ncbi:unnamed protein product [Medioppia subpectinata]|uniref:IPT/TIG domain-containing protein n=1 Tax=Medioppia subpectinata TaxID=1979941 RepID=A0A7R9KD74_9ACAR|nr:unnamed protein product [Medioppia subpectinata]CAG2101103.1 unnamed protein product [Medioppia subpectinata]
MHIFYAGTVQLLQLANSGQTATIRTTAANGSHHSSQSTPTSFVFNLSNLSQFQSGSGLLILNSPTTTTHGHNHRPNDSSGGQQLTAPLTLVYGRPNGTVESASIPNVICSANKSLHTLSSNINHKLNNGAELAIDSTAQSTVTAMENRLNYLNHLKTLNILNNQNLNTIQIKKEFEINGNTVANYSSDSENSDEITTDKGICVDNSVPNTITEESMIVNSNPSTPEHRMKTSMMSVSGSDQTSNTTSGVDLNCNPLNHSQQQPQHLSLAHNHNYNYNQYFNTVSNGHNANDVINNRQQPQHQTNINTNHANTGLMSYDMDANDLNPMDFIDNDIPTPDETLFNLDTFDILGDIDDHLDELSAGQTSNNYRNNSNLNQTKAIKSESSATISSAQDYREITANITDYSPEWCYPEGGMKVLVAGPYFTNGFRYTILFDGVSVTTHLVQNGLLRCYSPEHEPGFVTLQVASDGVIISNSVIFEYRDHPTVPMHKSEDYFSVDENIFKFSLLERFELLESRLSQCTSKRGLTGLESTKHFTCFEDRLLVMCAEMSSCSWLPLDESSLTTQSLRTGLSNKDMSLIHLTAALNYYKLIQCLLKWRKENPSPILELEVDAFACDDNECTPLMWSCAKGYYESSLVLYGWNRGAVNLCNKTGESPLQLARRKGHQRLVTEIERLESGQLSALPLSSVAAAVSSATTHSPHTQSDLNCDDIIAGIIANNGFRKPRKASLDIPAPNRTAKNTSPSTVKRGSACLQHGLNSFPKLVKCFSADSSLTNHMTLSDQLTTDSAFLSSCISDSEDDLEMSTSGSTNGGLSSSHRDSIGSCDIIMDCNGSESSRVLTLAEHIIAAMPDRIKAASIASLPDEDFDDYYDDDNETGGEELNDFNECEAHNNRIHSQIIDNFCNFSFEINDNYSYRESNTPTNSSPASSSCLHSPSSFQLDSPSPPPTAADFCEFFQASGKITKELGDLTLTDKEQRELYEAAKVIQKAYRSYKGRKRLEEQNKGCDKDKERVAAVLIQSYYRRYKHYIYYKQMTKAAQVIQNQFRNYCEHKRFKKSCTGQKPYAMVAGVDSSGHQSVVNNFMCNNYDCDPIQCKSSREGTPFSGLRRTYSSRRRNQAARKIQQFMRQSKNKLQRERALAAEEGNATQEVLTIRAQTQQSIN